MGVDVIDLAAAKAPKSANVNGVISCASFYN